MKNQNLSVRKLARCGMVAALYVVLCMALQPFSYGAVQVRVAEALCLLPVFGAEYIFGVVLGCFLANLLGSTIVDVIFGTLATLLACVVTYKLRNVRFKGLAIVPSLPPVLFNAVIIGIEIAVMFPDPSSSAPLWLACITNGISVGIGELISCTVLGVLLANRYALQSMGEKVLPLLSSVIEFLGKIVFVMVFIPRFAYNAVILCEPVIWCFMTAELMTVYLHNPFVFPKKKK